ILLYSITSRLTFNRVEPIPRANKCNEHSKREVPREDGAALARRLGCEFTETSAKTAQNVDRAVTSVVRALRQAKDTAVLNHARQKRKNNKSIIGKEFRGL
ncbi:hypothetical protein B0H14DRAFT_2372787, partial [Mycena olivaceomarginata]